MTSDLMSTLNEWIHLFVHHSMQNFLIYAKENNYSIEQINALFHIHHRNECGVSDLGEQMGVTSAAASQLLEKLVQQGLVERREDSQDRRIKRIYLTDKGDRILKESIQARHSWLPALVELLTLAEQEQVDSALRILIQKTSLLELPNPTNLNGIGNPEHLRKVER